MSDNDNGNGNDYPEPTPIRTPTAEEAADAAAAAAAAEKPDPEPETPPEPAEKSPYLTAAKMMPIEGVVYCLKHEAVHEDDTDPYDYGTPDCETKDHRTVYYRGRKGDVDEAQLPEPTERGVIAAAKGTDLSDAERELAYRLVDKAQNVAEGAYDTMCQIFGVDAEESKTIEKMLTVLENTGRKLASSGD
jgi:hypothetical protein